MKLASLATGVFVALALLGTVSHAQAPGAAGTANPELVGALAKELGSTPKQAEGAAGSLFSFAKTQLNPSDWTKVAGAVPGMAGLLKAAPAAAGATGTSGTSALDALGGAAGLGGMASVASAFSKLGLKPEMVMKAIPILTNFVSKSGGADVGKLLAGVLK
jgi:hypothetical protein